MKFLLESFSFLVKEANWKMISLDLNGILFCCDKAARNEMPARALMSRKRCLHVEYFWDQNSGNLLRRNMSPYVNSLHYTFSLLLSLEFTAFNVHSRQTAHYREKFITKAEADAKEMVMEGNLIKFESHYVEWHLLYSKSINWFLR